MIIGHKPRVKLRLELVQPPHIGAPVLIPFTAQGFCQLDGFPFIKFVNVDVVMDLCPAAPSQVKSLVDTVQLGADGLVIKVEQRHL
jgi:coenzyme F420-reducing hydrogenase gamma subunit